jgi:hypothetical protein
MNRKGAVLGIYYSLRWGIRPGMARKLREDYPGAFYHGGDAAGESGGRHEMVSGHVHGAVQSAAQVVRAFVQCRWGLPVPHIPHELGTPLQEGAAGIAPAVAEAKVENFLDSFSEPQCGHFVPCQSLDRTRISLSFSHLAQ